MALPMRSRPAELLIVEDNENDIFMMREAFKEAQWDVNLHVVSNGVECLAFLRKEGAFAGTPIPELVLLDLNMPIMDGRKTMRAIVADTELRSMPVVVMSTSKNADDIKEMYDLRCSTYIVKPLDYVELQNAVDLISRYWFALAALPKQ